MTVQDVRSTKARDAERAKLRRELSRLDTIFFLISAMGWSTPLWLGGSVAADRSVALSGAGCLHRLPPDQSRALMTARSAGRPGAR